jgi:hypothetical protein
MNLRQHSMVLLLPISLLCLVLWPQPSHAEVYVAGQFGGALPFRLTGLQGDQSNIGATLSDVALRPGTVYGGKIGYYSPQEKWLGMEFEAYQSALQVKQQTYTRSQAGTTTTGSLGGTSYKMTTYGLNLVVRYPGESFQPYGGIGLGLFTASGQGSDNTTAPGLNVLGGLRYKLGQYVGMFGELKYNRATIDFTDPTNNSKLFQGTYSAVLFVVGLSLHF